MPGKGNHSSYKRLVEEDDSTLPSTASETSASSKKSTTPLPTIKIKNWGGDGEKTRLLNTEKISNKKYNPLAWFK